MSQFFNSFPFISLNENLRRFILALEENSFIFGISRFIFDKERECKNEETINQTSK